MINLPLGSQLLSLFIPSGENPSKKFAETAFFCNQRILQAAFMGILVWTLSGPSARREFIPTLYFTLWQRLSLSLSRYNSAKTFKQSQDAYCAKVADGQVEGLGEFPEDLAWEPLSEVLRGRVKVQWVMICGYTSLIPFRSKFIVMKLRTWTVSRG